MRARGIWTTTALLSAAMLLSGCTGDSAPEPGGSSAVATASAVAVPSETPSSAVSPTAVPADDVSSSPAGSKGGSGGSGGTGGSGSGSSGGGSGGGSSQPPTALEPCVDAAIAVSVAADPQRSEMGRRAFRITFRNVGKVACTLHGFPQVGATGRGDRTPIGMPAEPDVRYVPKTERVAVGGSVAAMLLADNIDAHGGPYNDGDDDRCGTATGTGYNISAPASPRVFWVPRDGMLACTTEVTWMHVSPVLVP